MKSCSICKTLVKDNDNFCTFCGSKIQSLSDLIQEKRNELLSSDNKEDLKVEDFNNKCVSIEVNKFKRNRIILILVLIFLIMSIFLSFFMENKNNFSNDHRVIQNQVNKNDNIKSSTSNFLGEKEKLSLDIEPSEIDYAFKNEDGISKFENIDKKISANDEMISQLYNAADVLKMNRDKILLTSLSKDLNGKDLYKFVYNGHKFNALYGGNKLLYITNSLDERVFDNGQVVKSLDEFLVSYEDMLDISKISKMIINLIHDEPTVSKFPNIVNEQYSWNITCKDNIITVTSYVDYWNKKGRKIRETFKIILSKDNEGYKLIDLIFNGEKSKKVIY